MTGKSDFGTLMGQFKNLNGPQELLPWLTEVMELWEQNPDGQVMKHRSEIASAIQNQCQFPYIDTGMLAPQNTEPHNLGSLMDILLFGITVLVDPMIRTVASRRQAFLALAREWNS